MYTTEGGSKGGVPVISYDDKVSWIKAYAWIKDGIDSCRLKMGEPLPETCLANEIGVSRTPVREALRILAQEGYVKIIPLKGAFVSDVSIEDVREIYDIRKLIEPFAALSAVSHIPSAELRQLEAERESFTKKIMGGRDADAACIADLDLKLHFIIARYVPNRRIKSILINGYSQLKRFQRFSAYSFSDIQNMIEQHVMIVNCLKARDPAILQQCIYEHVVNSGEYVMKNYFLR